MLLGLDSDLGYARWRAKSPDSNFPGIFQQPKGSAFVNHGAPELVGRFFHRQKFEIDDSAAELNAGLGIRLGCRALTRLTFGVGI